MWDAPTNELIDPEKRIIHPVIIGHKHYDRPWVKVHSDLSSNWMGPEQEYLRYPTSEELNTLTWPELK